jgi:predicted phage-related endonuclease
MALTAEQIAKRQGKLTASRVACLMTGDRDKIMQLYLEMIGEGIPEDLSHIWPVRLGEATEALNLEWYGRKSASEVQRRGEVVIHPKFAWAAATLDGWDDVIGCPIETKHCGGREPLEVVIDRYQPQMQWQMEVTGATECALSVIMGASEPIIEYIPRDVEYAQEMLKRGRQFITCVENRTPPVALDPVPPPADASKIYDMSQSNSWAANSATWLSTKQAADDCKDAEKTLKALVPADAKKCTGHSIQITRDRAGRLSLREATP